MSKTVAVILDDDHWLWTYDINLTILAVEVLHVADAAELAGEPWWDALRRDLGMAVNARGSLGLEVPAGLTGRQRKRLLELFARAAQRLRARPHITAADAAEHYVVEQQAVFLHGASSVDTSAVADLAVAVFNLIRGDLPPPPPGTTAWFYGDGPPRGL
ncbi:MULTISPECIES: hypothetical protein [Micromonospora]|uniref:hypothetical protein n=1 Tax=Micromonospora TaxID=1873 RepID=UPI00140E4B8E|nr:MULTISPECIES: hypothetical protein [Micromonospora]NHO84407.1 hypothetical protein [Micromonospora sp. CMU55-4]WDP98160.1 hypothetical protein PVK74_19925 [Micromonospora chalcea]